MTMNTKTLQVLAVLLAFSGPARADDYAYAVAFVPVGFETAQEESAGEPLSCEQARETAWFIRELSRTDGDTNPEMAYVPCEHQQLAEASVDAD
jgi:hypothetical protein